MPITIKEPKKYLFEKAHEAAVILRLTLPILDESERETLEILLDKNFSDELFKRVAEMPRLVRQKKTLTHEYLKKKYS